MSDRLKKAGMFSTDSNFCVSAWVQEVVKQSVPVKYRRAWYKPQKQKPVFQDPH